jgi:hypothetical protein
MIVESRDCHGVDQYDPGDNRDNLPTCRYCGASARIKFDDEQFAALFNELQTRGDKTKLMQLFGH